mmetsp:Transcript_41952/g.99954  ORF Transcript_41952/g.99954 Transcript_41952/m.99954 type:complete len:222 (-) Transcript_41952:298-963(-)
MARLILAMACMASSMAGARAFLSAVQPATPSLVRPRSGSTAWAPGAGTRERNESFGQVSLLLGGLLAGAAFRSQRRSRATRFVTKQDILSLTVEDLPTHWSRISAGKARRHKQIQAITRQLDKTFFFHGLQQREDASERNGGSEELFPTHSQRAPPQQQLAQESHGGNEVGTYEGQGQGLQHLCLRGDRQGPQALNSGLHEDREAVRSDGQARCAQGGVGG